MSKPDHAPAFQFYPRDFLSSSTVIRMTPTERGIYITLLCVCWLDGGLPDDVKQLAKIAGVPLTQFARLWPHNLKGCFALVKNGLLVNARLEAEREKQAAFRDRQSANGGRGGRPKASVETTGEDTQTKGLGSSGFDVGSVSETHSKARALQTEESRSDPKKESGEFFADVALRDLIEAYPKQRITSGRLTEGAFWDVVSADGTPMATYRVMREHLENHKVSHEWLVKGMVPSLDKWLREGRWRRLLDAAPVAAVTVPTNEPEWARKARERKEATTRAS